MRNGLKRLPTWALAIAAGLAVGLIMAAVRVVLALVIDRESSLASNAVPGFINGSVFGLVMIPWAIRRNRREAERTGLEADELARAQRASVKGPVPDDPQLLRAARDLCADRVALLERRRVWLVGIPVAVGLTVVAAAVAWSLWFLLPAGAVVGLAIYLALLPALVRRRLVTLDEALAPDKPAAPGPNHASSAGARP